MCHINTHLGTNRHANCRNFAVSNKLASENNTLRRVNHDVEVDGFASMIADKNPGIVAFRDLPSVFQQMTQAQKIKVQVLVKIDIRKYPMHPHRTV